jgi:hypothetical protein
MIYFEKSFAISGNLRDTSQRSGFPFPKLQGAFFKPSTQIAAGSFSL